MNNNPYIIQSFDLNILIKSSPHITIRPVVNDTKAKVKFPASFFFIFVFSTQIFTAADNYVITFSQWLDSNHGSLVWEVTVLPTAQAHHVFKNGPSSATFIVYFRSFQTNITIFTTIYVKKCPSCIRYWDSNPWPLGHESPPITTRPGLPPSSTSCYHC